MTVLLYSGLLLLLLPIQTTLLEHISLWGVKPDLCLVATCLTGFLGGRARGLWLGLGLGFIQDMYSAGGIGLNMITKGLAGVVSGTAAKILSDTSPSAIFLPTFVLSFACGLVSLISARPQVDWLLLIQDFRSILLPQAVFDAMMALGFNWLIAKYLPRLSVLAPSSLR
ncbi:MAG: rod shape-determining protein MreD [Nitrospirota bacterium]|nr:MAG: rod shape-determining protein MreD [Nitrospirota bacterium]